MTLGAFAQQSTSNNNSGFKDYGGASTTAGSTDAQGNIKVTVQGDVTRPPVFPFLVPVLPKPLLPIPVITNLNPCLVNVPGDVALSQAGTARVIVGRPGLRILVCHERVIAGAAEQISEMEGTGTNCGTGTIFHSGSATAANGEPLAANGGFESISPFYLAPGNDYCIQQAGTARIAGKVSYLYVP